MATGEKPPAEPGKPADSKPESKPTAVPSFDVVRIEPTGDGVIAGRAEPGWTIALESGGNKIAETKVDEEGAWSIVLDKPLSQGDHSLTLRATSPDGTQGPDRTAAGQCGRRQAGGRGGRGAEGDRRAGEKAAPRRRT